MTQPESITRAMEVLRERDCSVWSGRKQHALTVLANAYARELDQTPISAEALVADGWVLNENTGAHEFRCGGPPEGIAVLVVYPRGDGTWITYVGPQRYAKTMGEIRTTMRQAGAYRE